MTLACISMSRSDIPSTTRTHTLYSTGHTRGLQQYDQQDHGSYVFPYSSRARANAKAVYSHR
jgi:hypothetical protein